MFIVREGSLACKWVLACFRKKHQDECRRFPSERLEHPFPAEEVEE